MVQFYQGTPESVMERLYRTISDFDRSWSRKCVPASDEQIQQLENICAEYGYCVPKVILTIERQFLSCFVMKILRRKNICNRGFFCFLTIGQKHIVI